MQKCVLVSFYILKRNSKQYKLQYKILRRVPKMNEDEKIQSVIEQYKTNIDTSSSDICHFIKGV